MEFPDGWTIEKIGTDTDLRLEGYLMRNCLSRRLIAPNWTVLSLRDSNGKPHLSAALEDGHDCIMFVEGKCSEPPKAEYLARLFEFARAAGLSVEPL